jgi:hypothetical protein
MNIQLLLLVDTAGVIAYYVQLSLWYHPFQLTWNIVRKREMTTVCNSAYSQCGHCTIVILFAFFLFSFFFQAS